MDDATNEHYSMFFVEEEGTASSARAVKEVIEARGLPAAIYIDQGIDLQLRGDTARREYEILDVRYE